MTEQQPSVQEQPKHVPGRFTTSMAVLKQPVPFPSELKEPQKAKSKAPWNLVIGLLAVATIVGAVCLFTQ